MSRFEIFIASVPDKQNLVAEIWVDNIMLAEISNEQGEFILEIYQVNTIKISLKEFINLIAEAERTLTNFIAPKV